MKFFNFSRLWNYLSLKKEVVVRPRDPIPLAQEASSILPSESQTRSLDSALERGLGLIEEPAYQVPQHMEMIEEGFVHHYFGLNRELKGTDNLTDRIRSVGKVIARYNSKHNTQLTGDQYEYISQRFIQKADVINRAYGGEKYADVAKMFMKAATALRTKKEASKKLEETTRVPDQSYEGEVVGA